MAPPTTFDASNVADFVVKQGNGAKGLVDMGLETLPNEYIQPLEQRFDADKVESEASIPIIDVSNWDDPKVAESICEAASELGFFQIINHGVPVEVLEKAKAAAHRFFALPVEEKKVYLKANTLSHMVRVGTSFNPGGEKALEWKDDLTLRYVSEEKAAEFWPSVCKDEMLEYVKGAEPTIKKLLEVLMKGLGMNEVNKTLMENILMGLMVVRSNYYPICPDPDLTIGAGRHSDTTSITVLLQDDIGGLYVRGTDGVGWIHVPPTKGALVVNIGDVLQMLSNDKYKSIEHQVKVNKSSTRVSVPIFLTPKLDATVGPLAQVLRNGEKPKYRHLLYSDYYGHHHSKGHEGKKTIEFAKI